MQNGLATMRARSSVVTGWLLPVSILVLAGALESGAAEPPGVNVDHPILLRPSIAHKDAVLLAIEHAAKNGLTLRSEDLVTTQWQGMLDEPFWHFEFRPNMTGGKIVCVNVYDANRATVWLKEPA